VAKSSQFSAQDDVREKRLVDLFNLVRPANRVRHGTDAILLVDECELEFELKSVTKAGGSISTVRDLGPDHIAKWENKHWIIAFYDGHELLECRYGSPDDMKPWIQKIWEYIRVDFEMAKLVPSLIDHKSMTDIIGNKDLYSLQDARRLQKKQYSAEKYRTMVDRRNGYSSDRMLKIFRERARYIIERGSTLNNPHIPASFFSGWESITEDHAASLRRRVRTWIASKLARSQVQADMT
jgi:hypothetical protein